MIVRGGRGRLCLSPKLLHIRLRWTSKVEQFCSEMAIKGALFRLKCKTFDSRWHWLAPGIEFNPIPCFAVRGSAVRDQRRLGCFKFNKTGFDLKFRKFLVGNGTMERYIRVAHARFKPLCVLFLYLWARFVLGTMIFPAVRDISVRRTEMTGQVKAYCM